MRRLTVASRKKTLQVIKEIDAFPKIPESCKETSASGGGSKQAKTHRVLDFYKV